MAIRYLRWIAFGVLLTGLGLAATAEAAKLRGLTVSIKASEAQDAPVEANVELYSKSYALVIGIDDYTAGWPRLGQAVNDARNVAKALKTQGFEVTLATNLNSSALEKAFEDFFIEKGKDPDARLFVWFAGHGHTDQQGEGYLIPTDGALERDRSRFLRTALSLRDFGKFVRYARSKHVFTIFDSCFAGTIFNVARAAPPPQITRITTQPVRQFLTSGDAGQTVSDDGTFAKLFIEALQGERRADGNGDGYLTASEMGSFLDAKMSNYTRNRQTPRYGKLRSPEFDKGDFVFALAAPGPRALPLKLVPPAERPVIAVTAMDEEMVAVRNANVRAEPTARSAKVAKLASGSKIGVTGRTKAGGSIWYQVALAAGKMGYVYGALLKPQDTRSSPPARARARAADPNQETVFWQTIKDSDDPASFMAYLKKFPNGIFTDLAEIKLKSLTRKKAARAKRRAARVPPEKKPVVSAALSAGNLSGCWKFNFSDGSGARTLCFQPDLTARHTNQYIDLKNSSNNVTCEHPGTYTFNNGNIRADFPEFDNACTSGDYSVRSEWTCRQDKTRNLNCGYVDTRRDGKTFRNSNMKLIR